MSLRPKVALLLGTASTCAPAATLSATRSSKATSQQIAIPEPDARRVDRPRSGARHEVPRPVDVLGEQPEERPPRQVLAERLDPPLVGAVRRRRRRASQTSTELRGGAPVRVRPAPRRPGSARRRRGRPGRSRRRRRRCAAGRCPRSSPARSPGPGAASWPAATSAASCSVSATWLSSTARRWALKSRPSRGTLPCTAAIVTVRTGARAGRRGSSRRQRTGRAARPARPAPAAATAAPHRPARRRTTARRTAAEREPGQHGDERQQRRPAERGDGEQRPVGLAEARPGPTGSRRTARAPATPPRATHTAAAHTGRAAAAARPRPCPRPRAPTNSDSATASASHGTGPT